MHVKIPSMKWRPFVQGEMSYRIPDTNLCCPPAPGKNSSGVVVLLLSGALGSALAASGWLATQIVDIQDLGKSCDIIARDILSNINHFF